LRDCSPAIADSSRGEDAPNPVLCGYLNRQDGVIWLKITRCVPKGTTVPYPERLKSLHLLTLKSRKTLLDLIFLYKCLNGLLKINLSMFIDSRDNAACNLRNADLSFKIQYTRTNTL